MCIRDRAYTEYRGGKGTREDLARKISAFTGAAIDPEENIILTPGTQGALFLAIGANMVPGDKVAIVEPDYFANRKLVEFFDGELVPIQMDYYLSLIHISSRRSWPSPAGRWR